MDNLGFPNLLHVLGLWEEVAVPGENPRTHSENMQTPHTKAFQFYFLKKITSPLSFFLLFIFNSSASAQQNWCKE